MDEYLNIRPWNYRLIEEKKKGKVLDVSFGTFFFFDLAIKAKAVKANETTNETTSV